MSIQYRFVPIYDNLNEDSEKVTGFYNKKDLMSTK